MCSNSPIISHSAVFFFQADASKKNSAPTCLWGRTTWSASAGVGNQRWEMEPAAGPGATIWINVTINLFSERSPQAADVREKSSLEFYSGADNPAFTDVEVMSKNHLNQTVTKFWSSSSVWLTEHTKRTTKRSKWMKELGFFGPQSGLGSLNGLWLIM